MKRERLSTISFFATAGIPIDVSSTSNGSIQFRQLTIEQAVPGPLPVMGRERPWDIHVSYAIGQRCHANKPRIPYSTNFEEVEIPAAHLKWFKHFSKDFVLALLPIA